MEAAGNTAPPYDRSDAFIAVMGVTGAGKSTFISRCCAAAVGAASDGLKSCTQGVKVYSLQHNGKNIHLIDTPGFDDTYRTDSDVLRELAYFLTRSYGNGYRLSGIVYLHPITHTRMSGTAFKNLRTFRKLCGSQSMSSTVLATTMWSDVTLQVGDTRERELRETAEFWGDMIREGSTVYRHTDDYNSAINIISFLTNRQTKTTLGLQAEMVDQKLSLDDTEAGREVDKEMNKQRELFERRLDHTRKELQEAIDAKDEQHVREVMQEQEKFEAKLAAIQQGREELRISMEALLAEKEKKHAEELARISEELAKSQQQSKEQSDEWQRFQEQAARQRHQDEVENKKREEELEAAKAQADNERLEHLLTKLEAVAAMHIQDQAAKERENEMLSAVEAEWNRREAQFRQASEEHARLLERQRQMEELRWQTIQLQQQQAFATMQQQHHHQQPPPSYQEHPPCYSQLQQPSYNYQQDQANSSYETSSNSAAVGTGVGLATGAALTTAAMMGGCSIM